MEPKSLIANVMAAAGRMTASQVMLLLGLAAGTVIGIVVLLGWLKTSDYTPAFSNLDANEAGEIVQYLSDNKIDYRLTGNGSTVEVPSKDVYQARISLASQGLPRNGNIGYELFDKTNLGMTDFLQNLNFRRALEGELTNTIMAMEGVQAARVHIVMPKDRLFKEDKREATASVMLKLGRANALSRSQISGITHLIAASVEGLQPENIAIVDYEGNLLSGGRADDPIAGLSSTQLDARSQVERYLQDKAQSMLDGVLGSGKAIVRVTADLNFSQQQKTNETYDPNTPVVRSEEKTRQANSTSDKNPEANESTETGNTETTVTNYEISKTVENIISAVGTIDRLSVAVTVDGTYALPEGAAEGDAPVYSPRSQDELDQLSSLVKNAVGFDTQRNDAIEVFNMPFDRTEIQEQQQALDSMYTRDFYVDIVKNVGIVALIIFGFLYVRGIFKKAFKSVGARLVTVSQSAPSSAAGAAAEAEPEPELPRAPRVTDRMQTAAKQHPEEIAKVIRTMMVE